MGGTLITVEAETEAGVQKKLAEQKRKAKGLGLTDNRGEVVEYDDLKKVWRGFVWVHS